MARLPAVSGRQAVAAFQRAGFDVSRQRGSHIIMQRNAKSGTNTVPVPDHKEILIGTLRSIIRQSGLARSEFES